VSGLVVLILLFLGASRPAYTQTAEEHEQHHRAAPATPEPVPGSPVTTGPHDEPAGRAGMTGAMGGMSDRMAGMGGGRSCCGGAPPPSPLYPSLIAVPELTHERREEFQRQANDRIVGGRAMISDASARLTAASQGGDPAAVEETNAQLREGLAQLESGLALRRVLDEGRAPRDVALEWFRGEMNLVPLTNAPPPHGLFGLSWFHYIVMFISTAFAVAMTAMYFRRMRRAEVLVARLAGGAGGVAAAAAPPAAAAPATTTIPADGGVPSTASVIPPDAAPSKPNSWTGLLRVARIFQETPNVKTFRLIDPGDALLPFTYLPGQFLTVTVSPEGQSIKRSYTIASSPTQRAYCEITVKREEQGAVSRFLHDRVAEGDTLQITAPSGKFTFTGEEANSVVLVGGGVGVTPMMSAVRYLTGRAWPGEIFFFYAVRSEADVIYREELEYLRKRYRNLHLMLVVEQVESPDWPYARGRLTRELLAGDVPELATRRVHICGPPPMMDAVKAMLTEAGVPSAQIRTEVFQGKEPPRAKLDELPATEAKVAVVSFARSRQSAMLPPTKTVLEASEDVGVNIDYSCRIGICGVCRVKLLSGSVTMEVQDGLEPGDSEKHIILACQAKSTADLAVDA